MDEEKQAFGMGKWDRAALAGHVTLPIMIVFVLLAIVPKFVPMYADLAVPLPVGTRALCSFSLFLRANVYLAPVVVVVTVAVVYGIYFLLRRGIGKTAGWIWLWLAIVGYVLCLVATVVLLFLPMIQAVNKSGAT